MLLGQYEGKLDEKSRVALPKKLRVLLGDHVIVTKGIDTNLIIVPEKSWNVLLEGTEGKPFINKDARRTQRFLLGNATVLDLDDKGRMLVPDFLCEYAKLTNEIIFAGVKRFVEVWDKALWEKEQLSLGTEIESIAERLTKENE